MTQFRLPALQETFNLHNNIDDFFRSLEFVASGPNVHGGEAKAESAPKF